jgi:hypothetical protein
MARRIEYSEYENGVIERLTAANKEHISPRGPRKGIGQEAFAEKYGFKQSFYSACLNGHAMLQKYIVVAVAEESGIPIIELDPKFYNLNRWERPRNYERRAQASEGNLLYILEQSHRDIDRPVAKIGITNNLPQRLRAINSATGVSDTWCLYRQIDLGVDNALDVEKATKEVLKEHYESINTEVFKCKPSEILGVAIRVISKKGRFSNVMWTIDPENISPELQEEFERIVEERRVFLKSEGYAQDEIDLELNIPINNSYWWN